MEVAGRSWIEQASDREAASSREDVVPMLCLTTRGERAEVYEACGRNGMGVWVRNAVLVFCVVCVDR